MYVMETWAARTAASVGRAEHERGAMRAYRGLPTLLGVAPVLLILAACGAATGDAGGTIHGPVITAAKKWNDAPTAGVTGKLELDAGCILLRDDVVFWPQGTTWDEQKKAVQLTDGTRAEIGQRFHGGGGEYDPDADFADLLDSTDAATRIARCLDQTGAEDVLLLTP
jgi:hypothetical protein